ncbi:MAG: type II methionyl aminopeptidase [Candidatus Woesearchaeota archaeon]
MDQETLNSYLKAGEIAAEVLEYGKSLIKPEAKVVEILDLIEKKIIEKGGNIAFPAQISLNEVAAHNCPDLNDQTTLKDQVVKMDIGVHIDGYIADTATTIDLSQQHTELVKASREALNEALKLVAPGTELREIGKKIHEIITAHGFSPIRNLSGHGLDQYQIHTSPSIPNFDNGNENILEEGDVIAIEPFASSGAGIVQESSPATLFSLVAEHPIRDPITRSVLKEIQTYQGLPFTKRWLERKFTTNKTNFALRNLLRSGCLQEHAPLVDKNKGMVSQAEHSVIVLEKPIVFTRTD